MAQGGVGICEVCKKPMGRPGDDAVSFLAEKYDKRSHVWVHHTCVEEWMAKVNYDPWAKISD